MDRGAVTYLPLSIIHGRHQQSEVIPCPEDSESVILVYVHAFWFPQSNYFTYSNFFFYYM